MQKISVIILFTIYNLEKHIFQVLYYTIVLNIVYIHM